MMETYFDKLSALYADTKTQFERLNGLQSALDRKVSEIYHIVEKTDFNLTEGHELARKLKETLQQRRVIKQEIALLMPVYQSLKEQMAKIEEQHNRAVRKSCEIKDTLNVTLDLTQVLAAVEAE
ncbi:hypothetical protein [Cytobacillus oceanisediminis]|uniref:Cell fate (Sporulation/competence/biofilm development) regulator YmcA (YheA/YmcA/DUF963 family) n=1 Tax=Cytobacillus oceanisediminis TaxID=665099 RepID=A0ABX3CLT0_9BACI|nr:hypothetical protein [Cytobacillus oceanisediminis]OHX42350.1 hypothetical protein BBV17_27520 [Cytobacillus oceanisediminis]